MVFTWASGGTRHPHIREPLQIESLHELLALSETLAAPKIGAGAGAGAERCGYSCSCSCFCSMDAECRMPIRHTP